MPIFVAPFSLLNETFCYEFHTSHSLPHMCSYSMHCLIDSQPCLFKLCGETPQGKNSACYRWVGPWLSNVPNWLRVSLLCLILYFLAIKIVSIIVCWHSLCLIKLCGERHLREKLGIAISEWDYGYVMCKIGFGFHCFAKFCKFWLVK